MKKPPFGGFEIGLHDRGLNSGHKEWQKVDCMIIFQKLTPHSLAFSIEFQSNWIKSGKKTTCCRMGAVLN
jgi:hypothetical protein